jgi:hypothetical protein
MKINGGLTMGVHNKIKLNQNKKSKIQMLRSWMTSFAVTVTAAVVVVMTIPNSPIATIDQVQAFESVISYQVSVTDIEQALNPGSLKVVLENQMEYYEQPLDLGSSVGSFNNLNPRTQYTMKIIGNKGFGVENLDLINVSTKPLTGGTIYGYRILDTLDTYFIDYEIDVLIFDSNLIYEEVNLYYAFIYEEQQQQPPDYLMIEILENTSTVLIGDVPNNNTTIHIYLEATQMNQEVVRLDEIYLHTPFTLESSLYLDQITDQMIGLTLYQSYTIIDDLEYQIVVQSNGKIIQTQTIAQQEPDAMHSGIWIEFKKLKPETDYTLYFSATYLNPYTLVREHIELDTIEWRTLGSFTYTYTVEEQINGYQIDVTLIDPNHNFQLVYYSVYEKNEFGEFMVYWGSAGFSPQGDSKTSSILIENSWNKPYRIEIGFRNQNNMTYYFSFYELTIKE